MFQRIIWIGRHLHSCRRGLCCQNAVVLVAEDNRSRKQEIKLFSEKLEHRQSWGSGSRSEKEISNVFKKLYPVTGRDMYIRPNSIRLKYAKVKLHIPVSPIKIADDDGVQNSFTLRHSASFRAPPWTNEETLLRSSVRLHCWQSYLTTLKLDHGKICQPILKQEIKFIQTASNIFLQKIAKNGESRLAKPFTEYHYYKKLR